MTKAANQQSTQPKAAPTAAGTSPTLWGRISQGVTQALAPRPAGQAGQQGQAGQRSGPGLGHMALGLVAYMVGSMALEYLILWVDSAFKLKLTTSVQTLFPTSWPLIGQMHKFELIYLLLLVAYVWLLFRLNVIPRDLFKPRGATNRNATSATTTTTATLGRSKSARKRAALTSSSATTAHGTTTRRSGAAARASREAQTETKTAGNYDDEYDRVRSVMRRRRKR